MSSAKRIFQTEEPFLSLVGGGHWEGRGKWPAHWVSCPGAGEPPFVTAYRLMLDLPSLLTTRVYVTADERYELFLDGARVGRGPERGEGERWFFETYELSLEAGKHALVAKTWSLGECAPFAQMSVKPGFLLCPADDKLVKTLATGFAKWETRVVPGYKWHSPEAAFGVGHKADLDGSSYPWGVERGEGDGWGPVIPMHQGASSEWRNEYMELHRLRPAMLPTMLEEPRQIGTVKLAAAFTDDHRRTPVRAADNIVAEADSWQKLLDAKGSLTIPAGTARRVLIDLGDYFCAYPEITVSGGHGSEIHLLWDEALYEGAPGDYSETRDRPKGNRGEVEGKYFVGIGDSFKADGGDKRVFSPPWWGAGRYLQVVVRTAGEPFTINGFRLLETGYPMKMESSFEASDPRLARTIPILFRGVRMCSHETYMDCPYYEQLMYAGDTRHEARVTLVSTRDDRLPRKAVALFDASRVNWGLTQSRYPSRVRQMIPPFALWWIGMVHDLAAWRGEKAFIATLMPGVRAVLDYFRTTLNKEGLVEAPNGWNFVDWVPGWKDGSPPEGQDGVNSIINWQFVLALGNAAELEEFMGELLMAERNRTLAAKLSKRIVGIFFYRKRSLLADDLAHKHFSEHSQSLAIMSGLLDGKLRNRLGAALLSDPGLDRTTVYFSHYLFEALRLMGRMDAILERMKLWFDLEGLGFKTTLEAPEPSRSDCHGWGGHPLFHYFASILGIRPAGLGTGRFAISPQLGTLEWAKGKLAHPAGDIEMEVRRAGKGISGFVILPKGISGTISHGKSSKPLSAGKQEFKLK